VGAAPGLAALLAGRAGREALAPLAEHGALALLPAGAPPNNPQELLSRPALARLLEELGAEFDVVVLDTPPARPYADAQSVAFRAGQALVLARKHRTSLADAGAVVRQLADAGASVIGTVCNAF
jgi:Mrp family chromosome partitioning ATPase